MPPEKAKPVKVYWTCPECGDMNLNKFKVCQTCGTPKPASPK